MGVTAWAYLCEACGHLASRHRLALRGRIKPGPYDCDLCNCAIPRNAPMKALTKREFERMFPKEDA